MGEDRRYSVTGGSWRRSTGGITPCVANSAGIELPGQHHDALGRVSEPGGVPHGVAVRGRARRRRHRAPRCAGATDRRPRRSRGRRSAPRSAAACRADGAWPAGAAPGGRRTRRRVASRRAGSRCRRPPRLRPRDRRRLLPGRTASGRPAARPAARTRRPAAGAPPRARPAARRSRAPSAPSTWRTKRGAERHHHVAERAAARRPPARGTGLEEERAQPDRRLRRAHLLQHRQLEATLHGNHTAVVHLSPPCSLGAARRPRPAARRRS